MEGNNPIDGVIKFKSHWEAAPAHPMANEMLFWRDKLFGMGLIGFDLNHQVGFGNMSLRLPDTNSFLISGTQTGHLAPSLPSHFTEVTVWHLSTNELNCKGPVNASSESLTHAALYECSDSVCAVLHVHAISPWERLLKTHPVTPETVAYGTPQMADAMKELWKDPRLAITRTLAMPGHEGGILSFGINFAEAFDALQFAIRL
jgi:L-ribulose-5-phosphate 4-epimerase